ncbi:MAG: hypothetical protein ACP5N3_05470 [Candidatus Nanoarchaeia archaeon]
MDKLSEFADEQIRKGEKPSELKNHLLRNGWKEDEVDSAVRGAVNRKIKRRVFVAVAGLLIIAILVFSLVSLAKNTKQEPLDKPSTPSQPKTDLKPSTQGNGACSEIESSIEKDDCYKQLLRNGYDCQRLTNDIELTYCNRAYEEIMLKGVEVIEEN